jgi:DNA invertase Pin-like site-specific DNA recombinase
MAPQQEPREDGQEPPPLRAAQYVRMSTDHQQYSTENQAETIREYAERHGLRIVRSYADEGKSGLRLEGRDQLQRLIADVESGGADFQVVLVYDVSRWGRFQDADESAYYEYVCKRAGIAVHYCAEQFANDGSPVSTIVKGVKRAMAGEYSRELSVKVFAGQCRLIELGYRQGGIAGYGLRRMRVDQHGQMLGLLRPGEQKSLQTDRVILVPGPADEIATVDRIYRLFVEDGKTETQIAEILNGAGTATHFSRPWTRGSVHQVLSNEKYIGNNVYNRVSFKLKKRRVTNPPAMWVRADQAFAAVVEPPLFYAAQGIIRERSRRYSDADMLQHLQRLYAQHGWLSAIIIDEAEGGPGSGAYRCRFGSLIRAYTLVGYTPDRDFRYIEINRRLRELHPRIVAEVVAAMQRLGGTIRCDPKTDLLAVNDEFTVSLVIARCLTTQAGHSRWAIRLDTGLHPDLTVAVRMAEGNDDVLDYYLLPAIDITVGKLRLAHDNGVGLDAYRFASLDYLFGMAERVHLREAA